MDVLGISGTICYCVLVLVPTSWFIIGVSSLLEIFFVELYDSIVDKSLLKAHAFLHELFVCLLVFHDHVVRESRMYIVNKHFDKVTLWYVARDSYYEGFSLEVKFTKITNLK